MTDPAGLSALVEAIRVMHGAEAKHVETVHVRETHEGELVWDGDVETFDLVGHPHATRAYAWSEATTGTKRRFFVALHIGPVDSPVAALRASIMADANAVNVARRSSN
jgi:hypothetical protein